jgi:RNA polymerase sigma-70 factor (ECF subfamily)
MAEKAQPDDGQLIAACLKGRVEAYSELVRRYQDRLFNALFRFLGNTEDALDVSQEAFLSAYLALRDLRRRSRNKSASFRLDDHGASPDRTAPATFRLEQQESVEQLQQALLQLSPDHRAVLVLKELEGMRYEEIAAVMDVPIGTVRSRLHRARLELKDILAPDAPGASCEEEAGSR